MKLVVFADYGLDDACATAYLLAHREQFDVIDIVPVGGNVEAEKALKNCYKLLAAAKADNLSINGIRVVDTTAHVQPFCRLTSVHGRDGMGDLFKDCASCAPVINYDEWVKEKCEDYRILSLGPATMVVDYLNKVCVKPAEPIVVMGGCVAEQPNYNGLEFNDALDEKAFLCLLSYNHVAATLDTCRANEFNYINKRMPGGKLSDVLINRSVSLAAARHNDRCYIYDYVAALALLHPERFGVSKKNYRCGTVINELYLKN